MSDFPLISGPPPKTTNVKYVATSKWHQAPSLENLEYARVEPELEITGNQWEMTSQK